MTSSKPKASRVYGWIFRNSLGLVVPLLLAAAVVTICELSVPWLLEQVIDEAISNKVSHDRIDHFGMIMAGVIILLYIVHHIYIRFEVRLICDTTYQIYRQMYSHLMRQPMSYFKRKQTGELIHRITNDTTQFEDNTKHLLADLPYELMVVFGVLAMMLYLDWVLAIIVFCFLVVTSIISSRIGRPLPTLEKKVQILGARFSNRLQEVIQGMRTVKAFGKEKNETERLDLANENRATVQRNSGRVESYLLPIFDLMEILGVVLVVWYGAHLILKDELSPGGLVAFIAYMEILAGPVSRAGKYYRHWLESYAMAQRIMEFLSDSDYVPPDPKINQSNLPHGSIKHIVFDRVSFGYPKTPRTILNELSFTVDKNEIVAIVGRNGAGKSTAMELLQRFYVPDTGRILVGNLDLRVWEESIWHQRLGTMAQDVFLFNTTIRENIKYGAPEASDLEIEKVCREAGVDLILDRFPNGLDSVVGEKGGKLSGGERQRIALARLFLMNPEVIIYDEPTAAMDGEAAKDVARTMLKLAPGRISLIIAHQAEMVAIADRVILLDQGEVIAQGTHSQLMETQELYRNLFETIEHKAEFQSLHQLRKHEADET